MSFIVDFKDQAKEDLLKHKKIRATTIAVENTKNYA